MLDDFGGHDAAAAAFNSARKAHAIAAKQDYQAPSADNADDDVEDDEGPAAPTCFAKRAPGAVFRAPLNKEPSSKAAKSVDDVTHVSRADMAAAASFCLRSARLRGAAMQSGARSRSWHRFYEERLHRSASQ